jgi:predicted ATPase/class 3 adenylate cyclase
MPNFEGYESLEKIDEGKDRTIYSAVRVTDHTPVILKALHSDHPDVNMIALMYHEFEVAKDINYPGIIKTYGLIDEQNSYALVQENMNGISLHRYLQKNGIADLAHFLRLAIQMVKILGYLHQSHIIHKDIKPSNFIYDQHSEILKLTDFNFSTKLMHETQDVVPPSKLEGTLAYMAPEQTGRMNMNIDYRADYYALGVTFYEMLTGKLPYTYADPLEMLHAHLASPIPEISNPEIDIPPIIKEIIRKLLAKNPGERYQSAIGLQTDLEHCLELLETNNRVDTFPLGKQDIQDHLILSQKLYGRERETQLLLKTYDHISQGSVEALMVCGFSGIGKTMLIDEVHKPMTKQKGYFIRGKFDQMMRDKPYSAITDALNQLAHNILAEPEENFVKIKAAILEQLDSVGQIIIDLAPEFELVIGAQQRLDELPQKETENRMKTYFKRFIHAVINGDHPLVIFIDDLQWADSGSLSLLEDIMMDTEMHHFLLIGAYRDNEVDATHPLKKLIEKLEAQKNIHTLPLPPLQVEDFSSALQDSLQRDSTSVTDLAKLLHQRTEGNPFFFKQILRLIYNHGFLKFNYDQRHWVWNLSDISALGITDNVVDLMLSKLAELPTETQLLLKYASCIGNKFTLDMLMLITNQSAEQIGKALWLALEQELLITPRAGYKRMDAMQKKNIIEQLSRDITYQFIHDRVQQAAYQSIPENEKSRVHLDIAHILVDKYPEASKKERLFEVVDHFNHALQELPDEERLVVAKLNYLAGVQAKHSMAYQPMLNYLSTSLKLINDDLWNTDYQLAFNINKEHLLALVLLRQSDAAEIKAKEILNKVRTNLDKAQVYHIQVIDAILRVDRVQALNSVKLVLQLFGIKLEVDPNPIKLILKIMVVRWKMRNFLSGNVAENMPNLTSNEIGMVFDMLTEAYFIFYEKSTESFVYMILLTMELMLQYGKPKSAGFWLTGYAIVVINVYKDIQTAIRYCDIAENYYAAIPDKYSSSTANLWNSHLISHWHRPIKRSEDLCEQGRLDARESGNLFTYVIGVALRNFVFAAEAISIDKLLDALENMLNDMIINNAPDLIESFDLIYCICLNLKNDEKVNSNRLSQLEKKFSIFDSALTYTTSNKYLSFFYFFKENYEKSIQHYFMWDVYEEKIRYELFTPEVKAINALTLMRQLPKSTVSLKRKYKKHIKKLMRDIEWGAKSAPMNYLHQHLFLKAYEQQSNHDYIQALTNYKLAIENAKKFGFILWIALIYELIGDLFIEIGQETFAITSYRDAYYFYKRYGMMSKVNSLASRYPECVVSESKILPNTNLESMSISQSSSSSGSTSDSLDLVSVIKASQTISSEIELDKLSEKMLNVMFENAGATKAVLIERRKEHLYEVASLELVNNEEIFNMPNLDIKNSNHIPHKIIQYTLRSREPLVLDRAYADDRFNQDTYIVRNQTKSILCLPILHQDSILGVIYLENAITEGAFTTDRISVLGTLASQIAVSLENARHFDVMKNLYQSTERFVPKAFLELLKKETIEDIKVGDSAVVNLAPMFADIRNFTSISESIGVDKTAYLLNAYMKQMTPIIRRHHGFVSVFLGDGIMSLFPRNYVDALNAALEMRASLHKFNEMIHDKGYEPIEMGIGIHAGPAMLITLGEEERLDASVVSDVVNSASRIEGLNKIYGTGLLISDAVYKSISDPSKYLIRVVDKVRVKGRKETMVVYEVLLKPQSRDLSDSIQHYFDEFTTGFNAYESSDFVTAEKIFERCINQKPDDKLAHLLKERCHEFIKSGSPEGWDGAYTALEK